MNRLTKSVGIFVSIFALTCTGAWAQATAEITGTVKDQSGAVLPGVEVTATQTNTGISRNTITNEIGSFVLPNLGTGPYRLEAALPGFRTYVQTGIVLQVSSKPVIDAVLQVGQITDEIEVEANAALVETRNTGVGQVIDNVRVLELPLNGRNAQELIFIAGGAVGGGKQQTNRNYPTDSISVAGGLNNGLTYLLDGGTHNDPYNNLNLPLPFPDALQEFKVETSAVPAQYGQHSAGVINAVTKSGTNEFHGGLFEFVRNGSMNARNAFALSRDTLKRNQYGGVLGGPIVKQKLFFFGGYQRTSERSAPATIFQYIPTAAMLAGDWTAVTSTSCNNGRQIALRAPFVNNRIDPALFAPQSVNLVKRLPVTTDPCGQVQFGRRTNNDQYMIVGRADYNWSEKHSLFGRYEFAHLLTPTNYDGVNPLTWTSSDFNQQAGSLVLGDTYLISANTISSFRATGLRTYNVATAPNMFSYPDIGANVYQPTDVAKYIQMDVTGGFRVGLPGAGPGLYNSTIYQVGEDLSMVRGAHQIGFGANYIRTMMNSQAGPYSTGNFSFSATNTGMGLGDFMLGLPFTFNQTTTDRGYARQNYTGLYLQDTWKARSRLTVSAGLRWEPYLAATEKDIRVAYFQQSAFDRGLKSTVFPNAPAGLLFPGDPGIPTNGEFGGPSQWTRFAPRVGLAWDPNGDGRMTIRAAYGIFNDYPHLNNAVGAIRGTAPWGSRVNRSSPPGGWDPWQGYPGGNPFPGPSVPDRNVAFPLSGSYISVPLNLKQVYVNQWNLSIQRQIGVDWLVSANYLGNEAIHMLNSFEGNPAVYLPGANCVIAGRTYSPCSSTANTDQRRQFSLLNPSEGQYYSYMPVADDGGTRSYNGMILSVQRRHVHGMTVQANYTWSHAIDDGTTATFTPFSVSVKERRRANRGNSELDRRHNFNLSAVYETPQFSSRTLRAIGSGWQVSGIVRILSGAYLTVASGLDTALSGTGTPTSTTVDQRPNQVLPSPYVANKSATVWLNPAAFTQPATGTYGTMGAQNVVGPGSITINMGLTRIFRVREKQSIEFRAEAFNMPNHVNPGNPTTILSAPTFGTIRSAADPRIMQLALKFVF